MNPTNKRSFIHRANRNRTSESDLERKARIAGILKRNFGLPCLFSGNIYTIDENDEWEISQYDSANPNSLNPKLWENYDVALPDIYIKSAKPQRIIELNGGVHSEMTDLLMTKRDKTKLEIYRRGGFTQENGTLVILDEYQQDLPEEQLIPILREKLIIQR